MDNPQFVGWEGLVTPPAIQEDIFFLLDIASLGNLFLVSNSLHSIIHQAIDKKFTLLKMPLPILGENEWQKYVGKRVEVPPIPIALKCEILKTEQIPAIAWIPNNIDGKPWTIRSLKENANKGAERIQYFDESIATSSTKKSGWFTLESTLIEGSLNKERETHLKQVGGHKHLPPVIVAATIMDFLNSQNIQLYLPKDRPEGNFVRCREFRCGKFGYRVGGLSQTNGLSKTYSLVIDNYGHYPDVGAATLHKY